MESPDYNYMVNGRLERIAANRVLLCIFTEFGLMNNRKMLLREFKSFIGLTQIATGRIETSERIDSYVSTASQKAEAAG